MDPVEIISRKIGRYFNSIKVAYLKSQSDKDIVSKKDDISRMISTFETSNEIRFTTLSDIPIDNYVGEDTSTLQEMTAEEVSQELDGDTVTDLLCDIESNTRKTQTVSITSTGGDTVAQHVLGSEETMPGITEKIDEERMCRGLNTKDILFISVAWIVLPAFRFFLLCPEVIWFDVTSHSNNKGYHLLTFSCRSLTGHQVVFLWIWVPNEQRFSFRWVFQHAIPNLIPKVFRDRVKYLMKDGDPQQRNEALYALQNIFVNAREGGCGYHIVQKLFERHVPSVNHLSDPGKKLWGQCV